MAGEGTGRRISAWCNLRWDDVDFQNGTIRWRAETDKTGFEQIVPMTDPVKDVAAAGGWRTEEVLTTSYQQADAETIKNVVLHPTHRIVSR